MPKYSRTIEDHLQIIVDQYSVALSCANREKNYQLMQELIQRQHDLRQLIKRLSSKDKSISKVQPTLTQSTPQVINVVVADDELDLPDDLDQELADLPPAPPITR